MRRKISLIIIIITLVLGLALVLYPTLSNILKTVAYHRAIQDYQTVVAEIDEETYDDILAGAQAYNEKLSKAGSVRSTLPDEELAEYNKQLVIEGTDVMGYVTIPKINVSLPVYHGTSDAVLQSGIGHLEGSSLPVGGKGTHAVLSAHRGLPSARLFTDIDQLVEGDTFTVRVLREVLTYQVDSIQTVLPNEINVLKMDPDQDYCTLLTCTPYGVNSHRLLVRGHRIPTPQEELADELLPVLVQYYWVIIFAVLAAILVFAAFIIIMKRRKKHKGPIGKHAK